MLCKNKIFYHSIEIIKYIINTKKINLNIKNYEENTVLMMCYTNGNCKIIKVLLKKH